MYHAEYLESMKKIEALTRRISLLEERKILIGTRPKHHKKLEHIIRNLQEKINIEKLKIEEYYAEK